MEEVELVIKIPEILYKHIMSMQLFILCRRSGKTTLAIIIAAIKNGTPLPKGHGRLIDADAVLAEPFGNTNKDIEIAETIIEADREAKE